MVYKKNLVLDKDIKERILAAINWKEGDALDLRLNEDDTIIETVTFENGYQMDIKCCGVQYEEGFEDDNHNAAWTEACLFSDNGAWIGGTEPDTEYLGEWYIDDDTKGDKYIVIVE